MNTQATKTATEIQWSSILDSAINEPGIISAAYSAFHGYSLGNQLAAMWQCAQRGITPGPIATFVRWQELGRYVCKGQKAIHLCMPITFKKKGEGENGEDLTFTRFTWKPRWFVLSQTEGEAYQAEALPPTWDRARALSALGITEVEFANLNGNVQGYAQGKTIAISPVAALPHKTTFHEMAHVVLGHTAEGVMADSEVTPRTEREMEAEGVAYILGSVLGLPGAAESRGYIQNWAQGRRFTEKMSQRIFSAANKILQAGRPAEEAAA